MRELDIVVVGATGYTGKIACHYLKNKGVSRWGIAGRSEEKLQSLKKELSAEIPTFTFDIKDPSSLDEVCRKASCVIACAGPFTLVGMPLVESCIRCKTHYIDSTGEYNFVRLMVEKYHEEAKRQKICLVPCCGFDSTPSDIGNFVVHQQAPKTVTAVKAFIRCSTAGMSSGTANSLGAVMDKLQKKDYSPISLNLDEAVKPTSAPMRKGLWYDWRERKWSCPFLMAACNERVVRRSNALSGSSAVYVEAMEGSFFSTLATTISSYFLFATLMISPIRRFLLNRFYKPGTGYGPSKEKKVGCFYTFTFVGETSSGQHIEVVLHDDREMYDVTGLYLAECALSAVALSKKDKIVPGVTTPSFAFGFELVERLKKEGIKITTKVTNRNSTS